MSHRPCTKFNKNYFWTNTINLIPRFFIYELIRMIKVFRINWFEQIYSNRFPLFDLFFRFIKETKFTKNNFWINFFALIIVFLFYILVLNKI